MVDRDARFVYQLVSTEVSPERNHISSERADSSEMEVGMLEGWAIRANACEIVNRHRRSWMGWIRTSCQRCIISLLPINLSHVKALTFPPVSSGFPAAVDGSIICLCCASIMRCV